jgi:hypothetical protein
MKNWSWEGFSNLDYPSNGTLLSHGQYVSMRGLEFSDIHDKSFSRDTVCRASPAFTSLCNISCPRQRRRSIMVTFTFANLAVF